MRRPAPSVAWMLDEAEREVRGRPANPRLVNFSTVWDSMRLPKVGGPDLDAAISVSLARWLKRVVDW